MEVSKEIKVGIIAGTPYDTKLGVEYFREQNLKVFAEAVAASPEEQNYLQYINPKKLEEITLEKIENLKIKEAEYIIIYCNSLSAVLDKKKLEKLSAIRIITPLDIYKNLVIDKKRIAILAANSQSAAKIEKMFMQKNPKLEYVSAGILPIVNYIEQRVDPATIVKEYGLLEIISSFKKMEIAKIVLGCTHFPYLEKEIMKIFPEIINPAQEIVRQIKNY
ncbi:aspartate/glutamate racemase family protein [Halanaerobium praevalens]|uniref:Asp/Glu/hydantoin racemase n=1 Tax=Halanaerobium praevalens (strain ATCC 33744 / DSM 2228 / GSL) TaxID=572479 RepID=E3DLW2_HALPG|nr:aspartate/glutamate racemase family protein [Halanaerobium praevalens]ADO76221.1 Asp/Glu/hydantoin racemase [Halanaerobium praevalens DSM 2228]